MRTSSLLFIACCSVCSCFCFSVETSTSSHARAVEQAVDHEGRPDSQAHVDTERQHRPLAPMLASLLLVHTSAQATTIGQGSRSGSAAHESKSQREQRSRAPWARLKLDQFRGGSEKASGLLQLGGKFLQWGAGGSKGARPPMLEQRQLNSARGDKNKMLKLYADFKKKSDADPDSVPLKLACADALVSAMRIQGNANALTCHFNNGKPEIEKMDTPENMAFWAKWAPTADKILGEVEKSVGKKAFAKDGYMVALALEAIMYVTSSKGIVRSLTSGSATRFMGKTKKYGNDHPGWDGNQPDIYAGATCLAAPWPLHDTKKGTSHFRNAAQKTPRSRRNHYFDGVGRFASGDYAGARQAMERALREPCTTDSEKDICDFLTREATRTIQMLKNEGY